MDEKGLQILIASPTRTFIHPDYNKNESHDYYLGGMPDIELKANQWKILEGRSAYDQLLKFNADEPIKLAFHNKLRCYCIMSTSNVTLNINVIIKSAIIPWQTIDLPPQLKQLKLEQLQLSKEDSIVGDSELIYMLRNMPPKYIIQLFVNFFNSFTPFPIVGLSTSHFNDIKDINRVISGKHGSCQDRTIAAIALLSALGCQGMFGAFSSIHAYREFSYQGKRVGACLGGSPAQFHVVNNPVHIQNSQNDVSVTPQSEAQNQLAPVFPQSEVPNLLLPYLTTYYLSGNSQEQLFQNLFETLSARHPITEQKNILITCPDNSAINAFAAAMQYYLRNKDRRLFVIHRLEDVLMLCITTDNGFAEKPSALVDFLRTAKEGDILLIDWSGNQNIAFNTIVDTERKINQEPILQHILVIVLWPQHKSIDTALRTRFPLAVKIKAEQCHLLNYKATRTLSSEDVIDNKKAVQLYYGARDFDEQYHVVGKKVTRKPSVFEKAMINGRMVLQNPPLHDVGFRHRVRDELNNASGTISEIIITDEAYNLFLHEVVWQLAAPNNVCWTHILSHHTYHLFFEEHIFHLPDELHTQKGWLKQYANKTLSVLLVDTMSEGEWARLLNKAKKYRCKLMFYVIPDESLLLSLYRLRLMIKPLEVPKNNHTLPVLLSLDNLSTENSCIIVADNIVYARCLAYLHFRPDLLCTVTQENFSELTASIHATNPRKLVFEQRIGSILRFLRSTERKTVMLVIDEVAHALIAHFSTLFASKPFLMINGVQEFLAGRLVIITNGVGCMQYMTAYHLQSNHSPQLIHKPYPLNNTQARLSEIVKAFAIHPVIFIQGHTATGKTTFVNKELLAYYKNQFANVGFYNGWKQFPKWAKSAENEFSLLLLDEVTMDQNGRCDVLRGLYQYEMPGVLIDGQFRAVDTKMKKVVCLSNYINYRGRYMHQFLETYAFRLVFDDLIADELLERIMKPILNEAKLSADEKESYGRKLLECYVRLKAANIINLTPRSLKLWSLMCLYHLDSYAHFDHATIYSYIYEMCLAVMEPAEHAKIKDWFKDNFSWNIEQCARKSPLHPKFIGNYRVTNERAPIISLLEQLLKLKETINKHPTLKGFSIPGLLLTGESGQGKSDGVKSYLTANGYSFIQFTPTPTMIPKLPALLAEAKLSRHILLIDEINTDPLIEEQLNAFMDEGGFVIATQNSSLLQDRDSLTPSLNDRFINCVVPNYTLQSIAKISKAMCGSKETAKILAENYRQLLGRGEDVTPRTVFLASCGLRRRAAQ